MLLLTLFIGVCLLFVQLAPNRIILPVDLILGSLIHLLDDFLCLFWAKMRLVVQLIDLLLISFLLLGPIHLHWDKILVLFLVLNPLNISLFFLSFFQLMIEDKLVFFFFSKFFQTNELLLITMESSKRCLVNNCQLVSRVIEINVTQTMIIHREWSVWFQKNWHLGVIWVWNWFSIQCFLNCSQQIPLSTCFLGCITKFLYCSKGFSDGNSVNLGGGLNVLRMVS